MLTLIEKILFLLALGASIYVGYVGFRKVYDVVMRGPGEKPSLKEMGRRLWYAAVNWIATKPIWQTRPFSSFFHILISLGFVFYFLVNFGDIVEALFPVTFLGHNLLGDFYRFLADLATVSVLIGVVYFIVRRFLVKDKALDYRENVKLMARVKAGGIRRDSLIVALFILLHVGFRLIANSFKLSLEGTDPWQPFSSALAGLWAGWPETARVVGEHLGFWMAIGLILAFIPYFPYTKHFHLIMSGINFLTKPKRSSLGALVPINFEDESIQEFGVDKIEKLPWTHLVDAYACIMCNRCQDACPAYVTGKELSPSALEVNKRYYLNEHLDELASGKESEFTLINFAISESAVWACTACGACINICPVGNEPMFDILYIRRHQMLMENAFPTELKQAYRGMERNGNPWNLSPRDRMKWTGDLAVPTVDDNPEFEILWWVGCAPSYDPRAQDTARAFAKVLAAAGVSYAILGEMERCTGDAARRSGNEALFFELAQGNIEVLNAVMGEKKRRIVTTCPHCLHTLGKEYGQYGGSYEVIHHTQLLAELAAAKKIAVARAGEVDMITFHDPCYLGRHNGILDAPREVLLGTNAFMVEMPRHGKHSFCCGAGGAQMWKEEEHGTAPVNVTRYEEAAATGAATIAVGCPFCLTMMTDAAKQADQGIKVKDVVEILAERLSSNGA